MPPFFGIDTFSLLATAFWVWMLIDCLFNQRMRNGNKIFWVILILFTQFFGALCYYIIKCSHRNPIDAFPYYLRTLKQAFQSSGPTMPSSSYQPRSHPQPPQPRQPQPPAVYTPPSYTQGYRAQSPARPAAAEQSSEFQPYQPPSAEAEYEQIMASYPEMELPPQE